MVGNFRENSKLAATGAKQDLFFIILSHESYIDRRNALRETWLTSIPKYKGKVGYAFFLGISHFCNNSNKNKELPVPKTLQPLWLKKIFFIMT
jgi:hypothetical protein